MALQAYLSARPAPVSGESPRGLQTLDIGGKRDSYLFVPDSYTVTRPRPLVLLLHGAGGHAHDGLRLLLHHAEDAALILLATASQASTWDIIASGTYGPDRELVDRALAQVFAGYAVDPAHLGIGGLSDGASYALSLGLANGDLFTHVLAFSPGFIGPGQGRGTPKVFISHGRADPVLPVEPCSRSIVRHLRRHNYAVRYDEFDGGHTIAPAVVQCAVDWFLDRAD
jgi:predicted esterase